MESRPELGLDSYDRMFPHQDTLPAGGFGNLIALPLQGDARAQGNTIFVNEDLIPHADPWLALSAVHPLTVLEVRSTVEKAATRDLILGVRSVPEEEELNAPWRLTPSRVPAPSIPGPLPVALTLTVSDQIYIAKTDLTPPLRNRLLRLAAFQNPEFYKAQAMRLPTYDKPRIVACAEDCEAHLALPRGCLEEIQDLLRRSGIQAHLHDQRNPGIAENFIFQGNLREDQQKAQQVLLKHDIGVLAATTAFGKTVLAASMIAARGVNTLVLVHRQQLMEQWVARLSEFLNIEPSEIGRLGGGRRKLRGRLDIALLQSMVRNAVVDDRIGNYGHIIVDECHHVSARNFEMALRRAKARFVLGLSATVTRKDGHHPIVFMQCGPLRHQVQANAHAGTRDLQKEVIVRPTSFRPCQPPTDDFRHTFRLWMDELIRDEARNRMIAEDVQACAAAGGHPLVLTERVEHVELLQTELTKRGLHVQCLQGGMRKRDLKTALSARANPDTPHSMVIVATGRFAGEGFDDTALDSLFLTLPVSWKGLVAQYVGRLHRQSNGKQRVRVYDYADIHVDGLGRMFNRRCKAYDVLGYSVLIPASALPGWPEQVPLPVDPDWKQNYAGSVRRLVRDGVDVPLARLFVDATVQSIPEQTEGAQRARSASEAFFFRRLDSLTETKGRFVLNARLEIAFRGKACMEVDFLDASANIVIELDGVRHFQDANVYRRDREKDLLLQQHGYLVLRFLAEDLSLHLAVVLDTVLRCLSSSEAALPRKSLSLADLSCA
jgi:superfamily II DNA or RNA helicase/very-short-patch-repair endonuclease